MNLNNFVYQGGANSENLQRSIFLDVCKRVTETDPVMIELGSNDAYYSICFNKFFEDKNKLNVCIEVSKNLLNLGINNAQKNNCSNIQFLHGKVGNIDEQYFNNISNEQPDLWGDLSEQVFTIKNITERFNVQKISILHMDIQGSEVFVLDEIIKNKINVEFLFISTHATSCFGNTYILCKKLLSDVSPEFLFDSEYEGGCGDGLIVCRLNT